MIQLNKYEKQWILLIKGHLKEKYSYKDTWLETIKPLFKETYGWDPDDDRNYHDFIRCTFNNLLKIHTKIEDNQSGDPLHYLSEVFYASFSKSISNSAEEPIERAINKLCGLIRCTTVVKDGEYRFELEIFND